MGTPVVFALPQYDHAQFGGLAPFLNRIGKNEAGEFEETVERDESGFVRNPTRHKEQAALLGRLCRAFMQNDSVTPHHAAPDAAPPIDEEGERYIRSPLFRSVRDFLCKRMIHKNKRVRRICKTLYLERKP